MVQRVYRVPDVSCQHCVRAITSELEKIPGVQSVRVDLDTKLVTVAADESVSDEQIRAGIEEAGYEIAA
ncbi:Copper chaperone CopZ [bacterium HR26]|nr:Copper chaperone CopZ [bacterium HR26]